MALQMNMGRDLLRGALRKFNDYAAHFKTDNLFCFINRGIAPRTHESDLEYNPAASKQYSEEMPSRIPYPAIHPAVVK